MQTRVAWGPLDDIADAIESVADFFSNPVDYIFKAIAGFVAGTLADLVQWLYSAFLTIDTPGVSAGNPLETGGNAPGAFDNVANWTSDHLIWLSFIVATIGIAVAGGRMIWNFSRGYHENLKEVLRGLLTLVIASVLVVQIVHVLLWLGDRYTEWILAQADYDSNGDVWRDATSIGGSVLLLLLFGGLVILSMIIQMILLMFRGAVLVVLAGTIILPAAAATTETGRKWLNKYIAWMLAFICMKPAAATIYAVAFKLFQNQSADLGGESLDVKAAFAGLVLLGGAVFVLPALLRLLTPVGVALAGSAVGGSGMPDSGPGEQSEPTGSQPSGGESTGGGEAQPGMQVEGGLKGGPSGASPAEAGGKTGSMPTTGAGGGAAGGGGGAAGGGAAGGGAAGGGAAGTAGTAAAGAATGGAALAVGAAAGMAQQAGEQMKYEMDREMSSGGEEGLGPSGSGQGGEL